MRFFSSKHFYYPVFTLIFFMFYSSIRSLEIANKSEELHKAEEISTYKDEDDIRIIANIYFDEKSDNYSIIQSAKVDEDAIAYAIYNKSYQRTGWDYLAISAYEKNDDKYKDANKAYAMGYIEGFLTKDSISQNFFNMIHSHPNEYKMPEFLKTYIQTNMEYMRQNVESKMKDDKYWEHVYYIYEQLLGLYEGYIAASGSNIIGFYEFTFLNSYSDMEDIMSINSVSFPYDFEKMDIDEIRKYTLLKSHCSALIKLAEDFSDI